MTRLGLFWVTAISTVVCAFMSSFVAWLFGFVIDVPNYRVHIFLAFVIPFFVSPPFSYLTALAMRDLQRARRKAVDLAQLDALTGIANRRAFFESSGVRLDSRSPTAISQGVLFIDIDHFKSINDRHGHEAGDAVLKAFAQILRGSTRASDLTARLGGEEFVVHTVDIERAGLAAIAAGILAKVRTGAVQFGAEKVRYTVSIGGAIGEPAMPIDALLSFADRQLYRVKTEGRDGCPIVDARLPEATAPVLEAAAPAADRWRVRRRAAR